MDKGQYCTEAYCEDSRAARTCMKTCGLCPKDEEEEEEEEMEEEEMDEEEEDPGELS